MATTYEVWYESEDGITQQETDEHGMPVLHEDLGKAKSRAHDLSKKEENKRAWVVERKTVFECLKKKTT